MANSTLCYLNNYFIPVIITSCIWGMDQMECEPLQNAWKLLWNARKTELHHSTNEGRQGGLNKSLKAGIPYSLHEVSKV